MIYLDSLVAFAHLLVEDRVPPAALWAEPPSCERLDHMVDVECRQ